MNYLLCNYQEEEKLEKKAIRDGFGEAICDIAENNSEVVVLNADLPGSLKLEKFIEKYPDRYIQVGVAEQNMAGIATGLGNYGKIPFITTFAAFSPGVNFSQIRLAAIGGTIIKIVGSHYGLNCGKDGASAHMNSDVSMMRSLPGMVIVNPADVNQANQATHAIANTKDISYLRVTREKFPVFIDPKSEFIIGKAQKLLDGEDITVISTGSMVYESLKAIESIVADGKTVDFINIHTIKPLDEEAIIESAKKTEKVVVIEEHSIQGGLGEGVARCLSENHPTKMKLIGVKDVFSESGSHRDLWKKYGLDRESISSTIIEFMK